jgi:ParB family chromosome partitioning protein
MSNFNDKAIQKFDTELTSGNVKAAMAAATAKSRDLWQVPIEHIHVVDGFNPRIHDAAYDAHIEDIAQSIYDNGFYQDKPLAGYVATVGDTQVIYVTEGSSRLAAARRAVAMGASITTLPVAVKDRSTSMEDLTIALVKGNNGKPFTPFELSIIAKRLVSYGRTKSEVAKILSVVPNYVDDLLTIAGAPSQIREWVQSGRLAVSLAVSTLNKYGDKAKEQLAKALDAAEKGGKQRASAKHMPGQNRVKYFKKNSAPLFEAVSSLRSAQVWNQVPDEIRTEIEQILAGVPEAEAAA